MSYEEWLKWREEYFKEGLNLLEKEELTKYYRERKTLWEETKQNQKEKRRSLKKTKIRRKRRSNEGGTKLDRPSTRHL